MEKAFAEDYPNWKGLIEGFKALGVVDGTGKPPTLRGAQQTWYRLKRDRASRSSPNTRVPIMDDPPVIKTDILAVRAFSDVEPPAREEVPRPKPLINFKPATFRQLSDKDS